MNNRLISSLLEATASSGFLPGFLRWALVVAAFASGILQAGTLEEVRLTEFLARNDRGIRDEDGDRSDWLEIRNDSGQDGDLGGWFLTDDPANLRKWAFPAVELAAGESLVVFASGKDRTDPAGQLHCSFRLSTDPGSALALVGPDGRIVDDVFLNYPKQFRDISYGIREGSPGYFAEPTPGADNGTRFDGVTADTRFSVDRGLFEAPFELVITSDTPGALIHYTTDGTTPDESAGALYRGPITISDTTVVRAIARKPGFIPTNVDTQTYLFPSNVPEQEAMSPEITGDPVYGPAMVEALTSVPTISLSFDGNDINRTEIPVSMEMLGFGEEPVQLDAGAVRFGGYVSDFLKHSFRLHFRSQYGTPRLEYPLFSGFEYEIPPTEDFDALELRAGNHDMVDRGAYLSNRFTDDSMIEMGHPAPHGRFVHVYFNGKYHGVYHLRERWNAAMLSSYFEGEEEEYDAINANNIGCCDFANGEPYDGDAQDWNEIISRLNGSTPYRSTRELLDVPNLIDFMFLWTSGRAEPEFRAAGSVANGVGFKFFIKDADGHLRETGLWEVDHPGPLRAMDRYRREGDSDFKILLADRIQKHFFNGGALTPEGNSARLQRRVDEMAPAYPAELARWRVHRTANNNPGPQLNRTPEAWLAYQEDLINNQFPVLTAVQLAKLRQAGMYPDLAAPVLSTHGGSLPPGGEITLTSEVPAVYFTTDGSDPRLPGGAVSPSAVLASLDDEVVAPREFIASGARWRYLDDGSDQGSAWREPDFDDSGWEEGPSELGYTEGDEATLVGFVDADPDRLGIQRNATTYFRHRVNVPSPSSYAEFTIRLKYDDAAAVYLNGREVIRTPNLSAAAAFDTYATADTPDEEAFFSFTVPAADFVAGENTMAVEIHNTEGSSDLSFDMILKGEVAPDAVFRTEPLSLTEAGPFQARAFDSESGEWSALTSTYFTINALPPSSSNLALAEIHYHPAEPASAAERAVSTDRDDYEFLELQNLADRPLDLSGVFFSDGIDFAFPDHFLLEAGARAVLVRDALAFATRYGEGIAIAGEYAGRLSNGGERLALSLAGSGILRELSFDDSFPWSELADGMGYSLVRRAQGGDSNHASPASWAPHTTIGGAPGADDAFRSEDFESWKLANGVTHAAEDLDGDGLGALLEYALGSDPNLASPSARPVVGVIQVGLERFATISFPFSENAADVRIVVEESSNLQNWRQIDVIPLDRQLFRSSAPIGDDGSRHFLRLVATLLAP